MLIINWIKVLAICLCDLVNRCYDPFENNVDLTPSDSINNLDSKFAEELNTEFSLPTGEFLYEHPKPSDSGDTALWQGICVGMKILRGNNVTNQLRFLKSLFVNNALIRGYFSDGASNDTTSNDSATGPLFTFYCALRFGDESIKEQAGELLLQWVKNLKSHEWSLVDENGQPTKYGKLENGALTDPLRITLLLAVLALAMAYDSSYYKDYVKLYKKYKPILAYPKVKLLWWDTTYDTHRAAISLHILYWMTRDEAYRKGLQRIWRITEKSNNAWVTVLCSEVLDFNCANIVKKILCTFSYELRQFGNVQSLNPGWPSVKWGDAYRAKKPLPLCKRGSQDFFWQRNMNSLNEWIGHTTPEVWHTGLDFLVCLWLARKLGLAV